MGILIRQVVFLDRCQFIYCLMFYKYLKDTSINTRRNIPRTLLDLDICVGPF